MSYSYVDKMLMFQSGNSYPVRVVVNHRRVLQLKLFDDSGSRLLSTDEVLELLRDEVCYRLALRDTWGNELMIFHVYPVEDGWLYSSVRHNRKEHIFVYRTSIQDFLEDLIEDVFYFGYELGEKKTNIGV